MKYQDTNLILLIGTLTKDSELKETKNGKKLVKFRLAVKNGEKPTTFIDCDWWSPNGALEYLKAGKKVEVSGRLLFEEWESKNGEKRSKHLVNIQNLILRENLNTENSLKENEYTKEEFEAEITSLIED